MDHQPATLDPVVESSEAGCADRERREPEASGGDDTYEKFLHGGEHYPSFSYVPPGDPIDPDSPEAREIAREIVERRVRAPAPCNKAPGPREAEIFELARLFVGAFGNQADPGWLMPYVFDWWARRFARATVTDATGLELWHQFRFAFDRVRYPPGEAWAQAVRATSDESLSCGIPDPRLDRLARLFRWLGRFHRGQSFHLTYDKMREALGLPSKTVAGRLAHRLTKLGMVELISRGWARAAGRPGLAAEWRWTGPE